MKWFPVVLVSVLVPVFAACDLAPARPLSELHGKEVHLAWSPILGEPGKLDVFVELDYQVDECSTVDATATIDGQRFGVFSRGESGEDQHGGTFCSRPGWSTIVSAGGDPASTVTIEIADETSTITYELTNPFAERTIRGSAGGTMTVFRGECSDGPGPVGNLVLPPGQEVTLSWSPATDKVDWAVLGGTNALEQVFFLPMQDVTVSGSSIRFVAPANAGQATRAKLEGSFAPATRRCEGAESCSTTGLYCSETTVRKP